MADVHNCSINVTHMLIEIFSIALFLLKQCNGKKDFASII